MGECILFARRAGYQKLMLWTNSVHVEVRRIYEQAGVTLIAVEEHYSFGHGLIRERWERVL